MSEAKSQPWFQLYASALVEFDPKQLIERVDATKPAIRGRVRDLQYDSDHHESGNLWRTRKHTLRFCAGVLRRCDAPPPPVVVFPGDARLIIPGAFVDRRNQFSRPEPNAAMPRLTCNWSDRQFL
jgi:hypothetical protein